MIKPTKNLPDTPVLMHSHKTSNVSCLDNNSLKHNSSSADNISSSNKEGASTTANKMMESFVYSSDDDVQTIEKQSICATNLSSPFVEKPPSSQIASSKKDLEILEIKWGNIVNDLKTTKLADRENDFPDQKESVLCNESVHYTKNDFTPAESSDSEHLPLHLEVENCASNPKKNTSSDSSDFQPQSDYESAQLAPESLKDSLEITENQNQTEKKQQLKNYKINEISREIEQADSSSFLIPGQNNKKELANNITEDTNNKEIEVVAPSTARGNVSHNIITEVDVSASDKINMVVVQDTEQEDASEKVLANHQENLKNDTGLVLSTIDEQPSRELENSPIVETINSAGVVSNTEKETRICDENIKNDCYSKKALPINPENQKKDDKTQEKLEESPDISTGECPIEKSNNKETKLTKTEEITSMNDYTIQYCEPSEANTAKKNTDTTDPVSCGSCQPLDPEPKEYPIAKNKDQTTKEDKHANTTLPQKIQEPNNNTQDECVKGGEHQIVIKKSGFFSCIRRSKKQAYCIRCNEKITNPSV